MHNLHTGIIFSRFFVFAPGCKLPHSLLLSRSHIKKFCSYVTNKQTNKQAIMHLLISTFCLQICTWQRHSSVATVKRALLPTWINVISLSARTVSVVVSTPAFQSRHPWFKSGWGYLFIVFVDFVFLLLLLFITSFNFHSRLQFCD